MSTVVGRINEVFGLKEFKRAFVWSRYTRSEAKSEYYGHSLPLGASYVIGSETIDDECSQNNAPSPT